MRKLIVSVLTLLMAVTLLPAGAAQGQGCTYTVQPGDTVIGIASRYGIPYWELQVMNQEQYPIFETLRVGWVLAVPCAGDAPPSDDQAPPSAGEVVARPRVNLNVRSGPSTTYAIIGRAPVGQPYTLEARDSGGNWVLFNTGGQRGWFAAWLADINGDVFSLPVSTEVIGAPPANPPSDDAPPAPGALTATPTVNLNVRSGPGTNYAVIGQAAAFQPVTLEARNAAGSWVLFNTGSQRGWLAAWLTNINGDVFSLPVSTEQIGGPPSQPPPPPPSGGQGFALGGQVQSFGHPDVMRSAGMTWVKVQHKWSPGDDPAAVAGRINQAHSQGFKILVSIPGQLYPSDIDFGAYPGFVAGVAALGADAIEVWNEQNYVVEWPSGEIDPGVYTRQMLRPAYQAIKAANPGTMVISGGPTPTGFNDGVIAVADDIYIRGMRDAGAANYMDCVGVHYNAGATSPDARSGHPADGGAGHYSWYFLKQYEVYTNTFPGKDLCYTEIGYVSADGYGSLPGNFAWAAGTSTAEHAAWLGRAAQIAKQRGNVRLFIVFNVDFTTYTDNDPQAGYAIIRPDGSCPACGPLAAAAGP
jgi:uncharacterized protein YraI